MQNRMTEVLVIEDDLSYFEQIKEMLSGDGAQEFSVQHVQYLADGLALLRSRKFDVVLVDPGLPDSRGMDTPLAVRNQTKGTPIVVLTVLEDEDAALKLLQMDIQDYLIKSEVNAGLLRRAIRYAIQRKSDSEALRGSEQRFVSFMLNLPAAAWIKDEGGRYTFVNAEAIRILSVPLTEVLGRSDEELFPPETVRQFQENDRLVFTEGGCLKTTEFVRQADGSSRYYLVCRFTVPDPESWQPCVAGVAFDVTESKRQEAEIERLASFPRLNPTPVMELDAGGKIIFCNPAAEEILRGVECGSDANPLVPGDLPDMVRELQEKGHPLLREIEINGVFYEESLFLVPEYNAVRIYATDISERKRAEQEREQLILQLESVLDNINEEVVIAHLDGNILKMNKEALVMNEIDSIEEVRRPLVEYQERFEVLDLEGRPVPFEEWPLPRAIRGERFLDYEVQVRRRDTGKSWIRSFSGTPVRNKAGEAILAVITGRDVTARKRMEEDLRIANELLEKRVVQRTRELSSTASQLQAETRQRLQTLGELRDKEQMLIHQGRLAAMGEMIGFIAHQWRQPLNVLGLIVQELSFTFKRGALTQEQVDASTSKAKDLIMHMSRTIDDFRNFFKTEKQKVRFQVKDVLEQALKLVSARFSEQQIALEVLSEDDAMLEGYPNEFSQVILNMLSNISDVFQERKTGAPRIVIRIFRENETAVITISDNAGGIPEEIIDRIFDPYFTTKDPEKGTGLGLYMAKAIIEKNMGGRLWARNTADGAEFRIEVKPS